jgi:hypothetical protein
MATASERPRLNVSISSAFISDWQWAIHAVVEYPEPRSADEREAIEREAQFELAMGIVRESRIGRARGARSVIVLVDGDREMAELFGRPPWSGSPTVVA